MKDIKKLGAELNEIGEELSRLRKSSKKIRRWWIPEVKNRFDGLVALFGEEDAWRIFECGDDSHYLSPSYYYGEDCKLYLQYGNKLGCMEIQRLLLEERYQELLWQIKTTSEQ